jgi:hypothetical protein
MYGENGVLWQVYLTKVPIRIKRQLSSRSPVIVRKAEKNEKSIVYNL